MPLDPAQRHQIEQDPVMTKLTDTQTIILSAGAQRPDNIALLREINDLERDDDGDVIIGTDADGHNDLMSRITAFLATHDQ